MLKYITGSSADPTPDDLHDKLVKLYGKPDLTLTFDLSTDRDALVRLAHQMLEATSNPANTQFILAAFK